MFPEDGRLNFTEDEDDPVPLAKPGKEASNEPTSSEATNQQMSLCTTYRRTVNTPARFSTGRGKQRSLISSPNAFITTYGISKLLIA